MAERRDHPEPHGHADAPAPEHEQRDVNYRLLFWGFVSLVVLLVLAEFLIEGGILGLAKLFPRGGPISPLATRQDPPKPRLQPVPQTDLLVYKAQERRVLEGYGWVDRKAGIVRIPVDQAMDLLLKRGLPEVKPAPPVRRESGGVQ